MITMNKIFRKIKTENIDRETLVNNFKEKFDINAFEFPRIRIRQEIIDYWLTNIPLLISEEIEDILSSEKAKSYEEGYQQGLKAKG